MLNKHNRHSISRVRSWGGWKAGGAEGEDYAIGKAHQLNTRQLNPSKLANEPIEGKAFTTLAAPRLCKS